METALKIFVIASTLVSAVRLGTTKDKQHFDFEIGREMFTLFVGCFFIGCFI